MPLLPLNFSQITPRFLRLSGSLVELVNRFPCLVPAWVCFNYQESTSLVFDHLYRLFQYYRCFEVKN